LKIAFIGIILHLFFIFFNPQVFLPILAQFRAHLVIAALTLFVAVVKGRTPGKAIQSWFFVIISIFAILSIYLSPIPGDAPKDFGFFYLREFAKCVLSYFMVILVVHSVEDLKKLCKALLFLSFTVGLISIVAFKAGIKPLSGSEGSFIEGRLTSFFGGLGGLSNNFAAMMILIFPIPIYMIMEIKSSQVKKIILLSASTVYGLCIFLSGSRGTLLALLFVLLIMLKEYRKRASFIFIVLLITAISTYQLSERLMERISVLKSPEAAMQDPTAESRIREMQYSLELIKSYPFTGVGIGSYRRGKIYFLGIAPDSREAERVSHNAFLQVGTEMGLPSMILLMLIVIYSYRDLNYTERLLISGEGSNPLYVLAKGIKIGLIGFIVALMFLPDYANTLLYFWIALAVSMRKIVVKEIGDN
jgi:O-antigen ligase